MATVSPPPPAAAAVPTVAGPSLLSRFGKAVKGGANVAGQAFDSFQQNPALQQAFQESVLKGLPPSDQAKYQQAFAEAAKYREYQRQKQLEQPFIAQTPEQQQQQLQMQPVTVPGTVSEQSQTFLPPPPPQQQQQQARQLPPPPPPFPMSPVPQSPYYPQRRAPMYAQSPRPAPGPGYMPRGLTNQLIDVGQKYGVEAFEKTPQGMAVKKASVVGKIIVAILWIVVVVFLGLSIWRAALGSPQSTNTTSIAIYATTGVLVFIAAGASLALWYGLRRKQQEYTKFSSQLKGFLGAFGGP